MLAEIKGGFKILVNEVYLSAAETRDLLKKKDPAKSRDLYHKSAYIATQVALLQKQIMELYMGKVTGYKEMFYLQGLSSICSRLERVSDILLNLDKQAGYLSDLNFLKRYRLDDFFHEILHGLGKINQAIEGKDVSLAVRLGHAEENLDARYAESFAKIVSELKSGAGGTDDLVTTLMIVHYLERIGDMLLEIGEKIIYIIMGEKIKLEQYKALGAGLKAAGQNLELGRMGFKSIWGGRSGCRIGVIGKTEEEEDSSSSSVFPSPSSPAVPSSLFSPSTLSMAERVASSSSSPSSSSPSSSSSSSPSPSSSSDHENGKAETVLFKHGPAIKLELERENLLLWSSLRPGLTPGVKAFIPARPLSEAALMLEYIPARNLQTIFLENASDIAFKGLENALDIMAGLWRETRSDSSSFAEFTRQAESRLSVAQSLYPHLIKFHGSIGDMCIPSIQKLLVPLKEMEEKAQSPHTMLIHGDFNLSNILYDPAKDRVYMLDLYRSRKNDYVQDVSVMLVSVLRLPVSDPVFRKKLTKAAFMTYDFAKSFSEELQDPSYEARLAFGLARSFLTSTRFVLEEKLAAVFVARARYLWEKLYHFHEQGKPLEEFRISREVLRFQIS
jgi:phosphate uptake regulator